MQGAIKVLRFRGKIINRTTQLPDYYVVCVCRRASVCARVRTCTSESVFLSREGPASGMFIDVNYTVRASLGVITPLCNAVIYVLVLII